MLPTYSSSELSPHIETSQWSTREASCVNTTRDTLIHPIPSMMADSGDVKSSAICVSPTLSLPCRASFDRVASSFCAAAALSSMDMSAALAGGKPDTRGALAGGKPDTRGAAAPLSSERLSGGRR